MKTQLFLSYRRDDSADAAGRIHDRLTQQYGSDRIFMDVDTIPPGIDFRGVIDEAVGKCQLFLVVIGPSWLTVVDRVGQVRLENPADFVRLEIEAALVREIPVIPILVGGADVPRKDQLPESLQSLAFRNAVAVRRNPDFHHDMDRLINWMKILLEPKKPVRKPRAKRTPKPLPDPPASTAQQPSSLSEQEAKARAEHYYQLGTCLHHGLGVQQDYLAAANNFLIAAKLGHAAAQFSLGWLYRNGWGVAQDYAEAVKWYRVAAEQNHADAQRNMGLAYENGWGVEKDFAEAMRWYQKSASHNLAAAQNNIAVLYEKGRGVVQDLAQALKYYRMAANNGHKRANDAVRRLAPKVTTVEQQATSTNPI